VTAAYVYGVVPAGCELPDGLTGLDDARVELVEHGRLAALVSDVPTNRPLGTREDLLAHERVVDTVAASATVLPMRFGGVLDRSAVAEELLGEHETDLAATVGELDGRVQYTVKARYERDVVLREVIEADPEIAELRERTRDTPEDVSYEDRVRLGELVVRAIEDRAQRDAAAMHEGLAGLAVAAATHETTEPEEVLNSAFLVERDRVREFDQAVDQLGAEYAGRIRFRLIGPLAPYDFVPAASDR
jgi:Gas vesicle synthesis protein GvpL/GvpF